MKDFYVEACGKNCWDAFGQAVLADKASGGPITIASKEQNPSHKKLIIIEDTWKTLKERYIRALAVLKTIISEVHETPVEEFGSELVPSMLSAIDIPYWDTRLKDPPSRNAALQGLRALAGYWRELRDGCGRHMTARDVAEALIDDCHDVRISDPDSPAGCIDLTPNISGARKNKTLLFFGVTH